MNMKRMWLYLLIFLLSSVFVYSQTSIYDQIKEIKNNPGQYTVVIGNDAKINEARCSSELAAFFGIKRSNFDNRIGYNNNLVVVGVFGNNEKIGENIGNLKVRGMLIKATNKNLIITGSDINNLKKAVDLVKNYEKNKGKLLKNESSSVDFFAPLKEFFSNIVICVIVGLVIIGSSTAFLIHYKKGFGEKKHLIKEPIQTPAYIKLKGYISENLGKGYTERQIREVLAKAGWNSSLLDSIFNKMGNFHRK